MLSWDCNKYIKYKVETFWKKKMIYLNYEQKRETLILLLYYWASETSEENFQHTYLTMTSWVSLRYIVHCIYPFIDIVCVQANLEPV